MKKVILLIVVAALAAPAMATTFTGSHSQGLGCGTCHTPHAADTGITEAPLWGAGTSTTGYTLYGTVQTTVTGTTSLCMTCHDGTDTDTTANTSVGSKTLDNMHPVSIVYSGSDLKGTADAPIDQALIDDGGNVECGVCHDVHDSPTAAPALRLAESALCVACHTK